MFPPSNASDTEQQFDINEGEDFIAFDFIDAKLRPQPILLVETNDEEQTNLDLQNNDEDKNDANDATISIEYFKAVRIGLLQIVLELAMLVR